MNSLGRTIGGIDGTGNGRQRNHWFEKLFDLWVSIDIGVGVRRRRASISFS